MVFQKREDRRVAAVKAREAAQEQWIAEFKANPTADVERALDDSTWKGKL